MEVGPGVRHLDIGDRVVALAVGQERPSNSPAHGAFQHFVVTKAALTSPIPTHVPYDEAVVLPLAAGTASAGLFGHDSPSAPAR